MCKSNHRLTCISDFWLGKEAVLPQPQSIPMLPFEHSLSPPTPSPTTTWSPTTRHRTTSTSISSTSKVSSSHLPIFQYDFLLSFRWEEGGEHFDDYYGIAVASQSYTHRTTRIRNLQHPKVTLYVLYGSTLCTPSRPHHLRPSAPTRTNRRLFSSLLTSFFPFPLFLSLSFPSCFLVPLQLHVLLSFCRLTL